VHFISNYFATFVSASAYFCTPNITPGAFMYSIYAGIPAFLHLSVQRYRIFCGAPAHLIGGVGYVKIAFPPLNYLPNLAVFSAYFSQ
jgi:hypothetical protein